jgi:hypothetical protein
VMEAPEQPKGTAAWASEAPATGSPPLDCWKRTTHGRGHRQPAGKILVQIPEHGLALVQGRKPHPGGQPSVW